MFALHQVNQEVPAGVLVGLVGGTPAAAQARFAQGLFLPAHQALEVVLHACGILQVEPRGPTAQQALVEGDFVGRGDRLVLVSGSAPWIGQPPPAVHGLDEPARPLAQHRQARAAVFAALVVMGGGGQQVGGKARRAHDAVAVEVRQWGAEALRVETHVIARQQHHRAVAGGVFHRLGGGRRGELLEAPQHLPAQASSRAWRQAAQGFAAEPVVEEVQQRQVAFAEAAAGAVQGLAEVLGILLRAAAGTGIGAIDREVHDQLQ
ncbi:hypothetical protein D3C72_1585230 [compost metagenome]